MRLRLNSRAPVGWATGWATGALLAALVVGRAQPLREQSAATLALTGTHEFLVRNWDTRNGLPSATVTAIARTPDGFLWIGTRQGLARFDGAHFRVFTPQNTPGFVSASITSLCVDRAGDLWIGTASGLLRAAQARLDGGPSVVRSGAAVAALAVDRDGDVWAAWVGGGVQKVSGAGSTPTDTAPAAATAQGNLPPVQSGARLFVDAVGRVCLFNAGELWVREAGRWTRFDPGGVSLPRWEAIYPSAQGGWWIASQRQLVRLTDSGLVPASSMLPAEEQVPRAAVDVLLEGRGGRVWAGTHGGGIFCYETEAGWRRMTPRRARPLGGVTCLYEDAEGLLWAGTSNRGLYQLRARYVTAWSLPIAVHEGAPHTVCVGRDGSVWVGTDGAGVFRFGNGVVTRYGRAQGLEQLSVTAILEDRDTNLWCATSRGLYRFEEGRFRRVPDPATGRKTITALFEDRQGRLWIGMAGALALRHAGGFELFELPRRARPHEIRAIAQDSTGQIWIGARGAGLFRLTRRGLEWVDAFQRPLVISLYCDAEDALWVGTMNGGLARLKGRSLRRWTTREGLPDNTLYAILEDERGTLWFSCNEGIYGLDKDALLRHVRESDPPLLAQPLPLEGEASDLGCLASGQPSATRSADGRFWFPVLRGIVAFDPLALPAQRPPHPPVLEEVRADGVPLARSSGSEGEWRVGSGARRIEFYYTAPEMEAPARLRFRYRLEGLDTDWVEAGNQRVASYAQLRPGRYRFAIMVGAHGGWRAAPAAQTLEVVPRFWERSAFRFGAAALLLVTVAVAVRMVERARMRRRLARLETQQAMERERARIARDLHDDIGSGLTEILLLGELASRSESPPEELRRQVQAMTEKVRQLAAAMDEVVWTVNPRNDSLPRLASYLCDRAREFFRPTAIACRIDVPDNLPELPISAAQRHHLLLAVKEALHNAARHSGAREVWLRLRCQDGQLQVTIEDDGRGLETTARTGDGLTNMRTRLETLGGRAEVQNRPQGGTLVRFSLPLR